MSSIMSTIQQSQLEITFEICFINSNRFSGSADDGPVTFKSGLGDMLLSYALDTQSYDYRCW